MSESVPVEQRYDKDYFEKWYRNPRHRVKSPVELARQVAFVLRAAEWVLGRPLRNVLDVGCGEAQWRAALRTHRPRIVYTGVDPSEYAVKRYGKRRNIHQGTITSLSSLPLGGPFDLVVCCGMLNYVPVAELSEGVQQVQRLTGGLAYLELFTRDDMTEGDTSWPTPLSAQQYRSIFKRVGFSGVGLHCYVPSRQHAVAELEKAF